MAHPLDGPRCRVRGGPAPARADRRQHIGARDPNRTVPRLQELTRPLWAGEPTDRYSSYDRTIPIIATGLRNLREHGPNGPVFLRFGRTHMQPLRDAIGNPRRDAALARRAERARAQQTEYQEQLRRAAERKRAEREAARPACAVEANACMTLGWRGCAWASAISGALLATFGKGRVNNAIRHFMWQTSLTFFFGARAAKRLGDAHEWGRKR